MNAYYTMRKIAIVVIAVSALTIAYNFAQILGA